MYYDCEIKASKEDCIRIAHLEITILLCAPAS